MRIRQQLTPPSPQEVLLHTLTVDIIHPGFNRPLFSLPAFSDEPTPSGDTQYGVDHRLVLDACRILTNLTANDQDGYIAHDCAGEQRVSLDISLLSPGRYFYHLASPGTTSKYRIVKDFSAWRLPASIPSHWVRTRTPEERSALYRYEFNSASAMSRVVVSEDGHCVITQYQQSCENAHLVPKEHEDWFNGNNMTDYNLSGPLTGLDDVANGLTLRSDVHQCLDRHGFVFYPVEGNRFVAYVVRRGAFEHAELFHQRLVTLPNRVSDQFVYARFAYTFINLPRDKDAFDVFPVSEEVERRRAARLAVRKMPKEAGRQKRSKLEVIHGGADIITSEMSEGSRGNSGTDAETVDSEDSMLQPMTEISYAAADKKYRDRFLKRFPDQAEEVDNPPESLVTSCHTDTPRMLRLMSEYMKKNPQVWKTSSTPAEATRPDVEGYYADLLAGTN
ncbi:hypothetical protein BD310DRAFT_923640 [Dichomitus squalens]|uniref:HNH nuclease domain-containing protein n=1 Tax=Dichomitus squalens TaxID=114155 RepID=A0A4Q9PYV8_9APHY|nr:hypothetical protein BD310DRAFT_923640 [Dichomitus squalens]